VRASIASYLARYSESVAKKEAVIIQARCRAGCLRRSAMFPAPDAPHARVCLRDQRGAPAGLHMDTAVRCPPVTARLMCGT